MLILMALIDLVCLSVMQFEKMAAISGTMHSRLELKIGIHLEWVNFEEFAQI